jgi:5-methylcytosine-specific restriction endonuclease McrA
VVVIERCALLLPNGEPELDRSRAQDGIVAYQNRPFHAFGRGARLVSLGRIAVLDCSYGTRKIHEIVSLFEEGRLNLKPGFQRQSVWTESDRRKLIQSIVQRYPIPSIFLYERQDSRGRIVYDVIDGKQRLESILMFEGVSGFRGNRFSVRAKLAEDGAEDDWSWRKIERRRLQRVIDSFELQTVEVRGDLGEVIDLFVRINSTGKRLTGQERRNAKFYRNPFLQAARKLAERFYRIDYWTHHRILTRAQISRMKHIEFVAELMASIHAGGLINKKSTLDGIIGTTKFDGRSLPKIVSSCSRVLYLIEKMFPKVRETRFANSADFYSLFMLVWAMDRQGLILRDRRRNRQAEQLLVRLSLGVDMVRRQAKRAEGARDDQRVFRDYLMTIQADTDSQANRKRREEVLRGLLAGLFEKKDERRGFSPEQRRLVWHSDERKRCKECGAVLTWDNFTIDHIKPHTLGGRTSIKNAALMCRTCNSQKGARPRRRRALAA